MYDTQVAAAFAGYGLSISLLDLVRDLCGVTLRKSQTVSDWSTRPFTPKQVEYLVDDVRYLFTLEDTLRERLRARDRESWADEEMPSLVQLRTYRNDPKRLYLRVSGNARMNRRELGILNELAALRDRYARERNIPLKYVLPDDVMVGLVQLRPKAVEELSQLRRIDAGTRRNLGDRIIEAVKRGEAIPEDELPPRAPKPLGPQREALVSTMAVLVGALAADNDVPTTLLLPRAALERIAREAPQTPEGLGDVVNLTSWRRQLVVDPLWELLSGESVLRVRGYRNADPRTVFERALGPAARTAAAELFERDRRELTVRVALRDRDHFRDQSTGRSRDGRRAGERVVHPHRVARDVRRSPVTRRTARGRRPCRTADAACAARRRARCST